MRKSITKEDISPVIVNNVTEIEIFAKLLDGRIIGVGEAAAAAAAFVRKGILAIDDKIAYREIKKKYGKMRFINTQDLMISFIKHCLLSVKEADHIKEDWKQNHRFALKINSFRDLL